MIHQATIQDVPAMGKIINDCAEHGLMLHRSLSFLYEHIREFCIAQEDQQVVGVCGLSVVWANLAEVYALAVVPPQRGRGLGRQLVEACVHEARRLGVRKLMTLTYETRFFEANGFEIVDRQRLPLKVWSDCVRCSKNRACDEVAMIRVLEEVPEIPAPQPDPPPEGAYEVPATLGVLPGRVGHRSKMDQAP